MQPWYTGQSTYSVQCSHQDFALGSPRAPSVEEGEKGITWAGTPNDLPHEVLTWSNKADGVFMIR